MSRTLGTQLHRLRAGRIVFLTGAGVSAESGIPTFRGSDGFWTVGSVNYRPEEMGTYRAYEQMPYDVWAWYLYRRGVCKAAAPNAGHLALVALEQALGERFRLVTQNVDGLHRRAGNSAERTWEVHGNGDLMRCAKGCSPDPFPIPKTIGMVDHHAGLNSDQQSLLICPLCKGPSRPHLLWFDEAYNEQHYRCDSALQAARRADALVTAGTSGATTLPMKMANTASANGALLIDINPETNPFSRLAQSSGGVWLKKSASEALCELAEMLAH